MKAGRIASDVRDDVRGLIKVGASALDICDWVENTIKAKGGLLAFPCNICINEVAAHYSPPPEDDTIIPKESLVKVDLGVHVDGYIADTATTVSLNPHYDGMVYAVNEALKQAIKAVKPGTTTRDVGSVIQKTINSYGFKPIWNLSGHQMGRYVIHMGKSIPNIQTLSFTRVKEDDVFAIEPFLTLRSGGGQVKGLKTRYIHRLQKRRRFESDYTMILQDFIHNNFRTLPFSKRWLNDWGGQTVFPEGCLNKAFNEMMKTKSIMAYPVLVERKGVIVAQAEHTVIVTKDGCLSTTH